MMIHEYALDRCNRRYIVGTRSLINSILLFFLVLAEYKYFCLPPTLDIFFVKYNIASNEQIKLLLSMAIIANNLGYLKSTLKSKVGRSIVLFTVLIVFSAFISGLRYGFWYVTLYKLINVLYFPFCVMALLLYVKREGNIFFLIKIITICNIIACVLFSLQAIIYDSTGRLFLTIYWYGDGGVYMRGGGLRITECINIVSLSFAISMCELINEKHKDFKMIHLLNAIASALYIYYCKTRFLQLLCIIVAAIVFFVGYKANKPRKLFFKTFVLVVAGFVLANGLYEEVVASLTVSIGEKSYVARAGAFQYYISMFKTHIFSGVGFVDFDDSPYYTLVHGTSNLFYPSDVGIVGATINYGVLIGLWYLSAIINGVKQMFKNRKHILFLILCIMLSYTSLVHSLLDGVRITTFALIILLEEYGLDYWTSFTQVRVRFKIR